MARIQLQTLKWNSSNGFVGVSIRMSVSLSLCLSFPLFLYRLLITGNNMVDRHLLSHSKRPLLRLIEWLRWRLPRAIFIVTIVTICQMTKLILLIRQTDVLLEPLLLLRRACACFLSFSFSFSLSLSLSVCLPPSMSALSNPFSFGVFLR